MKNRSRRKKLSEGLDKDIKQDRQKAQMGKSVSLVPKDKAEMWICKNGEHWIDVLPYFAGSNDPEKEEGQNTYKFRYWYHRDIGPSNLRVLCLAQMGYGECAICNHQTDMIENDAPEEKWEPLTPKPRMLYNIICYDKGEEKKGVQVWDEAEFYSQNNIMDIAKKRSRSGKSNKIINFVDPDNGRSISFEKKPPKGRNDYPKYTGFKLEDRDYSISDKLLDSCYTLDELIPIPTEEEIESMYYGRSGKRGSRPAEDEDIPEKFDYSELKEELDDADDKDDLEDIISKYDLDIEVKRSDKYSKLKKKIKEEIEYLSDKETDDEEDEALTLEKLSSMSRKQLKEVINEKDLEEIVDPDDYDDIESLSEAIYDEL